MHEPQLYQSVLEEGLKTASRYSIEKASASALQFFESLRERPASVTLESERAFVAHPETHLERNELGKPRPYQPTVAGFRQFINDHHRHYQECPTNGVLIDIGIQGQLRPEDALKLYEMAYFA
jgi:hypothetical protein